METLSFALVLIFILWLIDKHNLWRLAFKITLGVIAVGLVGFGCVVAWIEYDNYKTEKRETAEAAVRLEKKNACISRWKAFATKWDNVEQTAADEACAANPDAVALDFSKAQPIDWDEVAKQKVPVPKGAVIGDQQPKTSLEVLKEVANQEKNEKPAHSKLLRAKESTNLTTTEDSYLTCGHVASDEIVTLLKEDGLFVKVKTKSGQIGWAGAADFEVITFDSHPANQDIPVQR